ncbi:S41 family peptidase [Sphingomicrobium flavum]|uniref:S41 family peptidase n=1 Tax=Sphingomicrobium flavum TaxID=1229164 RepID=UPI0021AE13DC|nr:S41 family peptidase [Sphingomicrobium flavum]
MSLAIAFALAAAQPSTDDDWGETLRIDARAMHAAIADSHPGTINPDDPGFNALNDAQLDLALERAKSADDFGDYFFALRHYAAAFNDGHVGFGVYGNTPDIDIFWPGFIARDNGKKGLVVTLAQPWSGVPVGAELLSCDGKSAYEVGLDRVGARSGRWHLASERSLRGALVMIDNGDPYVEPIESCVFASGQEQLSVALDWRSGGPDFVTRYNLFGRPDQPDIAIQRLANGAHWVTIPSFDGNVESDTGKALTALVADITARADTMRAGRYIVFDLRGNGGGSSHWSEEIAVQLWGLAPFYRTPQEPMSVVWRASQGNVQSMRDDLETRNANGNLSDEVREWYDTSIAGMEAAIATGQKAYRIDPSDDEGDEQVDFSTLSDYQVAIPVYILTDGVCMSACLDTIDLWQRAGAIVIGQETGADTVYMDTRNERLPSGIGGLGLPRKYYVGRARGNNEPVRPVHIYSGDLADTPAVQAWVANLRHQKVDARE